MAFILTSPTVVRTTCCRHITLALCVSTIFFSCIVSCEFIHGYSALHAGRIRLRKYPPVGVERHTHSWLVCMNRLSLILKEIKSIKTPSQATALAYRAQSPHIMFLGVSPLPTHLPMDKDGLCSLQTYIHMSMSW